MSQQPSVESSTRSSPVPSINPALRATLGCLDVQLEEELARYRRQRVGHPAPPVQGLGRYPVRKAIDLVSSGTGDSPAPTPAKPQPATPPSPQPVATGQSPEGVSFPLHSAEQFTQTEQWDSAASLAIVTTSDSAEDSLEVDSSADFFVPANQQPPESEFGHAATTNSAPDSYLESSEQLLRSLADQEVSDRIEPTFLDSLLTPLGIGSLLLLLVSTLTLGYVVTNPSTLSHLGLDRYWKSRTPTAAQNPSQATPTPSTPAETLPSGPNLASDEFVDLNLDNLRTLKSTPTPSSVPQLKPSPSSQVPNPVPLPTSTPSDPSLESNALTSPTERSSVVPPLPTVPTPSPVGIQPTPGQTPTPEVTPSNPNPQGFYYVVAQYNGEPSLERVRQIIPDAYVVPEGNRIQLGAFSKKSQAQSLVTELQQQGITAEVYQP